MQIRAWGAEVTIPTESKIVGYQLLEATIPLSQPYVLSFAVISEIHSIAVRLFLENGHGGIAEAVPLPGYTDETRQSVVKSLLTVLPYITGKTASELSERLSGQISDAPFAMSAIMTAAEVAADELIIPAALDIPLLAAVSAERQAKFPLNRSLNYVQGGFKTIKVKVGRDIDADVNTLVHLLDNMPDGVLLRLDANQAYTYAEAERILDVIGKHARCGMVELVEQPFGTHEAAWADFSRLARVTEVPLMLDESIIHEADVGRAAEAGAKLIKLKLFKHQGIKGLLAMARAANSMGLGVVMGNGVATEIGNLQEAILYQESGLFQGASEGNGFAKLSYPALLYRPNVIAGRLVWQRPDADHIWALAHPRYRVIAESLRH